MELCFICNTQSDDGLKLNKVKSQHTDTRIIDLLKKILGDFKTKRTIDSEENCICSDCLLGLDEYDWACVTVKKQEKELYDTFKKTEIFYANELAGGETSENNCKAEDCSIDPLPEVKVESVSSFDFRSTTIRKIAVDTIAIKRESAQQLNEIIEIEDESSENDDDIHMDGEYVPSDSDEDYLPAPRKQSKAKVSKPITSSTTSDSNLKSVRKNTTSNTDNKSKQKDIKKEKLAANGYSCSVCGKKFDQKLEGIWHERWHKRQPRPQFTCDICSYVMDDQESFDTHRKLHDNKPKNECVYCGKVLSTRGNLTVHMRIHGAPNHICDICGKKFIHRTSFAVHIKCHANLRQYLCPLCPMKFNLDANLKNHMQKHKTEKEFACSICGRRFGYLGNKNAHEKSHTETDKIHACLMCDAKFANRTKMIQHMEKQHSTSQYQEVEPHTSLQNLINS